MNVTMKSMLGMNTSKTRSPWLRFSLKAWWGARWHGASRGSFGQQSHSLFVREQVSCKALRCT